MGLAPTSTREKITHSQDIRNFKALEKPDDLRTLEAAATTTAEASTGSTTTKS